MRYCSYCGQPLNPGSAFCHHCGAALKAVVPETDETPVQETPVQEDPTPEKIVTIEASASDANAIAEEKEFLEQTHRLLRWERKAWSIAGKVQLILGIVFAALFFLLGIVYLALGEELIAFGVVFFIYALVFGCMFIAIGIINIIAAGKIPQYTDTLYKDFRAAHKRCNSIGLIIFGYFFNTIALVFYVINFVRMKSNKKIIDRILTRQGVK